MTRRSALGILTAGALVVGLAFKLVTAGTHGSVIRPNAPPPVGAFRDGGVPQTDVPIERVLAGVLPRLLDHKLTDEAGRQALVASLREHRAFARNPALAASWRAMIDNLDRWMNLDSTDRSYRAMSAELRDRVGVVSDQLAAAQLGYYLDPEILAEHARRRAVISAYRIDEVAFVRADRARVRVLGVRRLGPEDEIAALGMTVDELGDPVVLLDRVDDKIHTQILPVLAGWPYWLGDDGWSATSLGHRTSEIAGDAIRRELLIALGSDAATAELATARLHKLVAASVRHHEAQHALDHDRDLRQPETLAMLGDPRSELAIRTRYELSGYLSQIASDMWLPQLTLWNLARHAFHHTQGGVVAEAYVAVAVIEGMARQLHIVSRGPVFHDNQIDRERLAALVPAIAVRSTTELRSAAARCWVEDFDGHLERIVDD